MRRGIFFCILSLALRCVCITSAARSNEYSNIQNVRELMSELHLSHQAEVPTVEALQISTLTDKDKASMACDLIRAVLGASNVSTPSTPGYTHLVQVNWSDSCWLQPRCIAQPSTARDISRILLIITCLASKFAVRSGGHNPNPGFAGIDSPGILIDMSAVDDITLSKDKSVVSIGAGNRAGRVYKTLSTMGKTIMGPRLNAVGIGGYMLGGGLTYFSSRYGFAADNIINYEVVLANSSVVNANATSNRDLWWALKGGGPNFGIVTRYDFETVDNTPLWFEGRGYDPSQSDQLLDAIFKYAHTAEQDSDAAITFSLTPESGFVEFIYRKPVVYPKAYEAFFDIPVRKVVFNSTIGGMAKLNDAISDITPLDKARHMIGSIVYKFDEVTLRKSYSMLLELEPEVKKFNASTGFVVQPFTSSAVRYSSKSGGNPIGLEPTLQNFMTYSITWEHGVDDEKALAAINSYTKKVEDLAKSRGVYLEGKIMNDANFMQKVLASYGTENLDRMKAVSRRYDPLQVFQKLQNDGFLLSKA
ncbi:FAD binding domain-containing protein, partial [Metarhizium majus ARSEF 297]